MPLQILLGEALRALEIVEESGVGGRADAKLGFREQFQHGSGQQVGARVAVDFQRLLVFLGQDAKLSILLERPLQLHQIAVDLGYQRGGGQPRAQRAGYLQRGGALRVFLPLAVGESNLDRLHNRSTVSSQTPKISKIARHTKRQLPIQAGLHKRLGVKKYTFPL